MFDAMFYPEDGETSSLTSENVSSHCLTAMSVKNQCEKCRDMKRFRLEKSNCSCHSLLLILAVVICWGSVTFDLRTELNFKILLGIFEVSSRAKRLPY